MRPFLLTVFGLFVSLSVKAQQYEISVSDHKFGKLIEHVEVGELIDLRYDKTNIGWVQKGMSNVKVPANLTGELEQQIRSLVNLNTTPVAAVLPVVVKVNKLALSEYVYAEREYAIAEVALEFLVRENYNSETYIKILNTGSVVQSSSITDVTGKHAENLAKALEYCFLQLDTMVVKQARNANQVVQADYLKVNSYYKPDLKSIPALQVQNPAQGVYRNFYEFKNNAPGLTTEVSLDKHGNFIYKSTGKKVENSWGFSDGTTAFIRFGDFKNYFPLTKKSGYFAFSGKISTADYSTAFLGSLLGGMAGGAVAAALTEKTQLIEFAVNPITGRITPAGNYGPEADLTKTAKVMLYRNAKNESPEPLSFFVNDSLYTQLPPNSSQEFTFSVPVSEMQFCLKGKAQTCQKFTPVLDRTLYMEISQPAKSNAKPSLKTATEQEAAYYLKIIKHNMEKGKK